ncbi:hypothetical protein T484DRAFT_1905131, partial [Baffinella frigidus]
MESPAAHLRSAQALISAWRSHGEDDLKSLGPTPHSKYMCGNCGMTRTCAECRAALTGTPAPRTNLASSFSASRRAASLGGSPSGARSRLKKFSEMEMLAGENRRGSPPGRDWPKAKTWMAMSPQASTVSSRMREAYTDQGKFRSRYAAMLAQYQEMMVAIQQLQEEMIESKDLVIARDTSLALANALRDDAVLAAAEARREAAEARRTAEEWRRDAEDARREAVSARADAEQARLVAEQAVEDAERSRLGLVRASESSEDLERAKEKMLASRQELDQCRMELDNVMRDLDHARAELSKPPPPPP